MQIWIKKLCPIALNMNRALRDRIDTVFKTEIALLDFSKLIFNLDRIEEKLSWTYLFQNSARLNFSVLESS